MKENTESFGPIFENVQETDLFWEQMKILEFSECIAERLEATGMNYVDLAAKMKVSPARITRLMSGSNNFTLRSMVKMARALGSELYFELRNSAPASADWFDYGTFTVPRFSRMCEEAQESDTNRTKAADHEDLALAA